MSGPMLNTTKTEGTWIGFSRENQAFWPHEALLLFVRLKIAT